MKQLQKLQIMKKSDQKVKQYMNLSGVLKKQSKSFIVGYQQKFWEIFDSGKKLAYRNMKQADYREQNIFLIKQCEVSETGEDTVFELSSTNRIFMLKAETLQQRDNWIDGITFLKNYTKAPKKSTKKKVGATNTSSTLASRKEIKKDIVQKNGNNLEDNSKENSFNNPQVRDRKKPPPLISVTSIKLQHKTQQDQIQANQLLKGKKQKKDKKNDKIQKKKSEDQISKNMSTMATYTDNYNPDYLNVKSSANKIIEQITMELLKLMKKQYIKYHTMLTTLKIKQQGIFGKINYTEQVYLLISPKSLYPHLHISDENLTNLVLPTWLEINNLYKIQYNSDDRSKKKNKFVAKQVCNVQKIVDLEMPDSENSFKINIGEILYQFYTFTSQQRQCVQYCLDLANRNAKEVIIDGKIAKSNYDKLIKLHSMSAELFKEEVQRIIDGIMPVEQSMQNPSFLLLFLDNLIHFLKNFIKIITNKKSSGNVYDSLQDIVQTIQQTIQLIHEELIIQIKRTWVSLYPLSLIKTVHILDILRYLNDYTDVVGDYVKSVEILEGMKQLSKIYVRDAWKNFETIILAIVEQEKKESIVQEGSEEDQFQCTKTNGVNDLFKFVYDVYQIAYPHWKSKIHLRNVNRLMQRALEVFVSQIRSLVDEQFLPTQKLIGLANNYFDFNEYVTEFYKDKFSKQLHESIEETYKKIVTDYREVSLIIIDKLSLESLPKIEQYCKSVVDLSKLKSEEIFNIVTKNTETVSHFLHLAFRKKFYDRIAHKIHQYITDLVLQQAVLSEQLKEATMKTTDKKQKKGKIDIKKMKKPIALSQICEFLRILNTDLTQMFKHLGKSHLTYSRASKEIQNLLNYDLHSDITEIIESSQEPLKTKYQQILFLREDYNRGSVLYGQVNQQSPRQRKKSFRMRTPTANKHRKASADLSMDKIRRKNRVSYTGQYLEEEMRSRDDRSSISSNSYCKQNNGKLISCGYMLKKKINKKLYEKQYFRLKNGILYIYESEESDRCNNNIPLSTIKLLQAIAQKTSLLLSYQTTLGNEKQIKLKCQTIQIRDRWITSIELEKKRIMNEEKIKKKKRIRKIEAQAGRKKNQLIIDFLELQGGTDYFSYIQE